MFRLLVISDSHGERQIVERILRQTEGKRDMTVHLGDGYRDVLDFSGIAGELRYVTGNMDHVFTPVARIPETQLFEKENVRIMITHGHRFHAHSTMEELFREARNENAGLVLYGHTHDRDNTDREGIVFFNPGAAKHGSYGIIELDRGKIINLSHFQSK